MHAQAVVLAGGLGTRLLPLTKDVPKPLVEVGGKPFLHWQLRYLKEQGVTSALILVAHLGEMIEAYFKANPIPGLKLVFAYEPEPLGTGGALRNALAKLEPKFWLINGDSFLPINLKSMAAYCERRPWNACMAVLTSAELVPVPGNVKMQGKEVAGYQKDAGKEKGYPHVDAGVYLATREMVQNGPKGKFDLSMYWPGLIAGRQLGCYPVRERFYDIGTPERLKEFEAHLHDYF